MTELQIGVMIPRHCDSPDHHSKTASNLRPPRVNTLELGSILAQLLVQTFDPGTTRWGGVGVSDVLCKWGNNNFTP